MSEKTLRVAIVGAGPAGLYAAGHLLDQHDVAVAVDLIDRLPTPYGLVRAGVAPDHPEKKLVIDRLFDFHLDHPAVRFFGNVEFGKDITHEDLKACYDAVIYAVGAGGDAALGLPGEDLPGSHSARDFVGWYNGHPDFRDLQFDLSCKRAVIVGNGNVALDVARILTLPQEHLRRTEIADHALEALAHSAIEEVVILGRRGPEHAAFNNPEIEEFGHLDGVDVLIEGADLDAMPETSDWNARRKLDTLRTLARMPSGTACKRIVLRFLTAPIEILGDDKVVGLRTVSKTQSGEIEQNIETGLILRSVGYRGKPVAGLPFDSTRNVIPSERGRILDQGKDMVGAYVTGWIKRGPRGVIGTNKKCAFETVRSLLEDASAGRLGHLDHDGDGLERHLAQQGKSWLEMKDWKRIDKTERVRGTEQGRHRVKLATWDDLLEAAAH